MNREDEFDEKRAREFIRTATYEDCLRIWRFEPNGSPWLTGEIGRLFYARFDKVRNRLTIAEMSVISDRVGFKDGRAQRGAFDQPTERKR